MCEGTPPPFGSTWIVVSDLTDNGPEMIGHVAFSGTSNVFLWSISGDPTGWSSHCDLQWRSQLAGTGTGIEWCHANTESNHAFPSSRTPGIESLCGNVVHPGEIKTYAVLITYCQRCIVALYEHHRS